MGASTNAGNQPRPYACFNFLLSMHPTKTKTKTINENENPKTKTVLVARSRCSFFVFVLRFRLWFSFVVFVLGFDLGFRGGTAWEDLGSARWPPRAAQSQLPPLC
jgi:hypothetical protein